MFVVVGRHTEYYGGQAFCVLQRVNRRRFAGKATYPDSCALQTRNERSVLTLPTNRIAANVSLPSCQTTALRKLYFYEGFSFSAFFLYLSYPLSPPYYQ